MYTYVCMYIRMYITKGLESVCMARTRYFVAGNLDAVTGRYA